MSLELNMEDVRLVTPMALAYPPHAIKSRSSK